MPKCHELAQIAFFLTFTISAFSLLSRDINQYVNLDMTTPPPPQSDQSFRCPHAETVGP